MKNRILFTLVLFISSYTLHAQSRYGYYGVAKDASSFWNVGLRLCSPIILGDVDYTLGGGYEVGLYVQKKVTKVVDFRLNLDQGMASGMNNFPSSGIRNNSALNGDRGDTFDPEIAYDTLFDRFYHNYRTHYYHAGISLKLNLNRIFAPFSDKWDLYVSGGIGTLLYASWIDAADAQGNIYDFSQITLSDPIDNEAIANQLAEMRDGTYETISAFDPSQAGLGRYHVFTTSYSLGAGFRFKLNERLFLGAEGRYIYTSDDMLDGQQWDGDSRPTGDVDRVLSARISLDVSLGGE